MNLRSTMFFILWMSLAGMGTAPAIDAPGKAVHAIEFLSSRSSGALSGKATIDAFAGSTLWCRWLVHRPDDKPIRIELDIFQAMSSTVAPLHKDILLADNVRAGGNNPYEAAYAFEVPALDRPLRYLLRLRVERDGAVQPVAVATLMVSAAIDDLLGRLKGSKVSVVGFDDPEAPWMKLLSEAGVDLDWIDPASLAAGAGQSPLHDLVIVRCTGEDEWSDDARLTELGGRRILKIYDHTESSILTIMGGKSTVHLLRADAGILDQLVESPAVQKILVHFFTADFTDTAP